MNSVLDINLNSVKIALLTLGRKSRIKSLVKISNFRAHIVNDVQFTCVVYSVNIPQLDLYPKADGSTFGFVDSKLKNHDV